MVRWICNVRLKNRISSDSLLEKFGINNIQTLLRYNRLRWFGHVAKNDGCINSITALEVNGHRGRGWPRKTWRDTINDDRKNWKLTRVDPANRIEWEKTQNKHGNRATHSKRNQHLNWMMIMMMMIMILIFFIYRKRNV